MTNTVTTSGRFTLTPLPLPGLVRVQRQPLQDTRGFFERMFCAQDLAPAGWTQPIAQINHSLTRQRGSVRGLHYQRPPHTEMKLVSCLHGVVWDVAVDVRPASPTFLQWHAERLSPDNGCALLIPPGFAHGFQALTDDAEIIYFVSAPYSPENESGLRPHDPRLSIDWPLKVTEISARDAGHAFIEDDFQGVVL